MSNQVSDTGSITQIDNNFAAIVIDSTDDCKDCGIRFLCSPDSDKKITIRLDNTIDAKVGDTVAISEASNILLKLSFLQYGLPLLGFLLGVVFGTQIKIQWQPIELYQFLCGLLGLGLAGIISYLIINGMAKKPGNYFKFEKI